MGRYTLEPVSDSKDFKNSPEKKNDPQRFAKKSSKPPRVTMFTMESLITGYLRSVYRGIVIPYPPAVLPIGYVEPSLITGLASTTEGYSASIMCSTLARN